MINMNDFSPVALSNSYKSFKYEENDIYINLYYDYSYNWGINLSSPLTPHMNILMEGEENPEILISCINMIMPLFKKILNNEFVKPTVFTLDNSFRKINNEYYISDLHIADAKLFNSGDYCSLDIFFKNKDKASSLFSVTMENENVNLLINEFNRNFPIFREMFDYISSNMP